MLELPLVPKEHGASFMSIHALLLGIVAGFAAGGTNLVGLLLALGFEALFLPLTAAVSVLTHRALASRARRRALVLGLAFVALGVLALQHGPLRQLLLVGVAGAALGVVYAIFRSATGPRSVPTQLTAIASICLLAPLAWLLIAGPSVRWQLSAVAAFLAFGGTVPYVRERVRRRRLQEPALAERLLGGALALGWQAITVGVAIWAASTGLVSWLVPVAFLPGAVKTVVGIATQERRPPIKKIGFVETGVSTAFAVLAGIGLGIAP